MMAGSVPKAGAMAATLAVLAGCAFLPAAIDGVPAALPWTTLPLRPWIAEGGVHADAISLCDAPHCAKGTVVGHFTATGDAARDLERTLRDPSRLKEMLDRMEREKRERLAKRPKAPRPPASDVSVRALGDLSFEVIMMRPDGSHPMAGIVRGMRVGDVLHVTIATGRSREALGNR